MQKEGQTHGRANTFESQYKENAPRRLFFGMIQRSRFHNGKNIRVVNILSGKIQEWGCPGIRTLHKFKKHIFSETFGKNRNRRSGMAPGSIPHTGALGRLSGNSFLKPVSQAAVCRLENEIFKTKDGKTEAETTKGYGMNHNPFENIGAEGQNRLPSNP